MGWFVCALVLLAEHSVQLFERRETRSAAVGIGNEDQLSQHCQVVTLCNRS